VAAQENETSSAAEHTHTYNELGQPARTGSGERLATLPNPNPPATGRVLSRLNAVKHGPQAAGQPGPFPDRAGAGCRSQRVDEVLEYPPTRPDRRLRAACWTVGVQIRCRHSSDRDPAITPLVIEQPAAPAVLPHCSTSPVPPCRAFGGRPLLGQG